jgi:hypothetical protein
VFDGGYHFGSHSFPTPHFVVSTTYNEKAGKEEEEEGGEEEV